MKKIFLASLSLVVFNFACASDPAPKGYSTTNDGPDAVGPAATYYSGAVVTTSPDGETATGAPVKSLATRQMLPAENKIVEQVWHSGRHFVTTLIREKGGSRFQASDAGGTFSGTVTFTGDEWDWNGWTYDIQMKDGSGKLTGRGAKTDDGRLIIEKIFEDASGAPQARIMEDHKPISTEEFEDLLKTLPKTAPAAPEK